MEVRNSLNKRMHYVTQKELSIYIIREMPQSVTTIPIREESRDGSRHCVTTETMISLNLLTQMFNGIPSIS